MDLQWEKLSPQEFQKLKDLITHPNKELPEALSEFEENGCFARYNRNGEVDLDGFRAFITSYLEADTPEELIQHLFFSFVKKKPAHSQQQQEVAGRSSEAASKGKALGAGPKEDKSTYLAPGTSQECYKASLEELTEKLRSLRYADSSDETSDSESISKETYRALMSSSGSFSDHGSEDGTSIEMTTRSVKPFHDKKSDFTAVPTSEEKEGVGDTSLIKAENVGHGAQLVSLKDITCYFSLLEAGKPRDKLEFLFRLFDTDGDGVLNKNETKCLVEQMMNVARYIGWEVSELRPVFKDMMIEIDYDKDGTVSLDEWLKGGLTTMPLLALLGLDCSANEDKNHVWRPKVFKMPAYCNLCRNLLRGFGSKGLCCDLCKFIIHEECLKRSPRSCITTYSKVRPAGHPMLHHWVEGNCSGKCFSCKGSVKRYGGITGRRCRWCQIVLHNRCARKMSPMCTLGPNRVHIIPPTAIYPAVLDRRRKNVKEVEMPAQPCPPNSLRIEPVPAIRPLLVFINPKSGGQQGAEIKHKFQYYLNPKQVYDLMQDDPMQALHLFKYVKNLRIICCGGDGTTDWIMQLIDKSNFATYPTIGVIPLGTGNDLARCLEWGGGYDGEPVNHLLQQILNGSMMELDRWNIEIIAGSPNDARPDWDYKTTNVITNYFSVGVDAAICLKFHTEREKNPEKFNSRIRNKLWYFEFAASEIFSASCRNLHQDIELECDGVPLDLANGQPLQGIAVLNIPSTHGGVNLWGKRSGTRGVLAEYRNWLRRCRGRNRDEDLESDPTGKIDLNETMQDIGDGLIEVVGLESCLHIGQVRAGLRASARRLAQCSTLTIRTKRQLPMQIDGEPWMQNPSTIKISHRCQVPVLKAPTPDRGLGMFCDLL